MLAKIFFGIACIVSLMLSVTTPLIAENHPVHAKMVNEAVLYIRTHPEHAALYRFLRNVGVDEAIVDPSIVPAGLRSDCYQAALLRGTDGRMRFNPLAYEACLADFYEDMFLDVLGTDLEDIVATADQIDDLLEDLINDSIERGLKWECLIPFFGWFECGIDAIRDIFRGARTLAVALRIALGGVYIIFDLVTGDIIVSNLDGLYIARFNHFQNVTEPPWSGHHDFRGYFAEVDASLVESDLLSWALLLSDATGAGIAYDPSYALHQYKQNGSTLRREDFETRVLKRTEFEPADNMATYGVMAAMDTHDLIQLGRALHAAGETAVPMHIRGLGAGRHSEYEDFIDANWEVRRDRWISPDRIQSFLATFNPVTAPDAIITHASQLTNRLTMGLFDDDGNRDRISIGIVCIITLLDKMSRQATTDPMTGIPLSYLSTYPYPESEHPVGRDAEFSQFQWHWLEDKVCDTLRVTFSDLTNGNAEERVQVYRITTPNSDAFVLFGEFSLNALAGTTLEIPKTAGVKLLYVPTPNSMAAPGWGFRIVSIECID